MQRKRSFGWIQNPSDFNKLKRVVGVFSLESRYRKDLTENRLPLILKNNKISKSDYELFVSLLKESTIIPYNLLKGQGAHGTRSEAMCSGIIQACLDAQNKVEYISISDEPITIHKPYSDDWTSDGYLRWAISLGFIEYHHNDDTCDITALGQEFVNTLDESLEEYKILTKALMSYPPVQRILTLLKNGQSLTKFEIGSQLGFKAELGFTSISQDYFIALYNEADAVEKKKIKSNIEGDSDKYARMICSWLNKMGWIKSTYQNRIGNFNGQESEMELPVYSITAKGVQELTKAQGNSSNPQIPKIVLYEMLATKAPNAGYLRFRRATILKLLSKKISVDGIVQHFRSLGKSELSDTIIDDIEGFERIGLNIVTTKDQKYYLKDKIVGLNIPVQEEEKENITTIKENVRQELKNLNHEYLVLIDLAFSDNVTKGKKNLDARNFEIHTANLLTKEIGFEGKWMGGSDKPDVVIWKNQHGYIIDNKSYKDGLSIGRKNEDEICRYIDQAQKMDVGFPSNNWWQCFKCANVTQLYYMFVTSFLTGNYKNNLKSIHQRSGINGGAVQITNLLRFAEHVKRGSLKNTSLYMFLKNDEVVFPPL